MNAKMLITGVAVAVLAAGAAAAQTDPSAGSMGSTSTSQAGGAASTDMSSAGSATQAPGVHRHHAARSTHARRGEGGSYAAPQQPIPYAQLDQYMKAPPRQRMAMEQKANTGATADTAAIAPTSATGASDTGPMQNQPGAPGMSGQAATPDSSMGGAATPPVNGATSGAADQVPDKGMGGTGSDTTGTPAAGTPNQSSGPTPH